MILSTQTVQFFCFALAMFVYAAFGSPTPDQFGWAEVSIAILLMASVHITRASNHLWMLGVIGYGLFVPVLMALINGHDIGDILRDIIPFLFLFLPVMYGWIAERKPYDILKIIISVGIIFSLRTLVAYQDILVYPTLWGAGPPADLLYLANSPEVLFSSLYCLGQGTISLVTTSERIKGILLILLSVIPLAAMVMMTQRAGIGAVFLYSVIGLSCLLYHHFRWGIIFLSVIGFIAFLAWPVLGNIAHILIQKTELVGLNSRAQEWGTVFGLWSQDWTHILFGGGWGTRLENPAVGGLSVNYTHSLFSALLLKTGIIGVISILLAALYPVWTAFQCVNRRTMLLFGAALLPFLVSSFLYASYKSLGFGLILLVFSILSNRNLEKNHSTVP